MHDAQERIVTLVLQGAETVGVPRQHHDGIAQWTRIATWVVASAVVLTILVFAVQNIGCVVGLAIVGGLGYLAFRFLRDTSSAGTASRPSAGDDRDRQREVALATPFVADDHTVARVDALMREFNEAVGNDARMRAVQGAVASASGYDDFLEEIQHPGANYLPWKMLAAVALRAAYQGNHLLVGRICAFMSVWDMQIAPHLRVADFLADIRLEMAPPAIAAEIATVAFDSLRQLPGDQIVFSNATGTMTVRDVTILAANVLVNSSGVDEAIKATARQVIGARHE